MLDSGQTRRVSTRGSRNRLRRRLTPSADKATSSLPHSANQPSSEHAEVSPDLLTKVLVSAGSDPPGTICSIVPGGSEQNFQHFLARVSVFFLFCPISCPHLVKYLFIQQLDYSQKLLDYGVDTALSPYILCVFSNLFIQKLF